MKLLILVDKTKIGLYAFNTYIFEGENEDLGYGIFIDGFTTPLVVFENFKDNVIRVSVEEKQVRLISENSKFNMAERHEFYKQFMDFVKLSEKVAAAKVFKNKKMEYLAESKCLVEMRNIYLNGTADAR